MKQSVAIIVVLVGLALACAAPLFVEARPVVPTALPPALALLGRGVVGAVILAGLLLQVRLSRFAPAVSGLALAATALVVVHGLMVEAQAPRAEFQRSLYCDVLNLTADAPHQYRPAPFGLVRTVERLTGNWAFAVLAYRWSCLEWFLWAAFAFAGRFLDGRRSAVVVAVTAVLYPFAVAYYWGQLTDPLAHALFALALLWIIDDRVGPLAAALALGVAAKETAVLLVPAYQAVHFRLGRRTWGRTAWLAAVAAAAFLVCRLPLGWGPGFAKLNGTEGLMIAQNLGLVSDESYGGAAPWYQNYLHPLALFGPFLPVIVWRWRRIELRLRALTLVLVPGVLLSSLCFSWLYESRNYWPIVPLLATTALAGVWAPAADAK